MKMIFLGLLFCEESLEEAYRNCKGGVQMAPHLFESRLIEGLSSSAELQMQVISVPPIGSFPFHYRKVYSKAYRADKYIQIGYWNLPGIKHKIQIARLRKEIRKAAGSDETFVLVYSMYEPFLDALVSLKKKMPNLHVTVLQPDAIPGRNGMVRSRKMERWGNRLVKKSDCADDFVFLSGLLQEVFDRKGRPFSVVDCICDTSQQPSVRKERSDSIFLYTGTTARAYGICNMVECFAKIPEAQLWICGAGDSDEYIRQMATQYHNVKHFGYLSQQEVANLRDKCDYLINPRVPTGTFTRYSFPSKTAEYLLSGKPVVMYRLEGLGVEYDDMLNYVTATQQDLLIDQLRQIIQTPYDSLLEKADRARTYMLENKNAAAQGAVILNMLRQKEK